MFPPIHWCNSKWCNSARYNINFYSILAMCKCLTLVLFPSVWLAGQHTGAAALVQLRHSGTVEHCATLARHWPHWLEPLLGQPWVPHSPPLTPRATCFCPPYPHPLLHPTWLPSLICETGQALMFVCNLHDVRAATVLQCNSQFS